MARRSAACAIALFIVLAIYPTCARAVHPDSPEVRAVIDKALKYLETSTDSRLGGKCLIGLAFLKDGADEKHPRLAEAVRACQNAAKTEAASIKSDIYSTGIAIIFLCSLNPSKYSPEIMKFRESLELRQKPHGGWGYADRPTGDTSMSQYAILAWWEMRAVGLPTSVQSTERFADWLLRTQDPEGNWGYQGKIADDVRHLIKQDPNRIGMTAAGMGMTYMVADLLNLIDLQTSDGSLPPALRLVRKETDQKPLTNKIDLRHIRSAQIRGRDWIRKNYDIDPDTFPHYYLYALERYQSFAEAAEGRFIKEPKWYNDGYAWLKKTQEADGCWKDRENMDAVNTAFGVLFLLRSTRKAIERSKAYGEGALLAGRGFPEDLKAVRVRGGYVVPKEPAVSTSELLDILGKPSHPEFSATVADVELLTNRIAAASPEDRERHEDQLRRLAEMSAAPDARVTAVQILGKLRSLDACPTLIRALADSDWRVVQAAEQALKSICRDTSPSQLGLTPNAKVRQAAIERWKSWYLAFAPDAELAP